MSTLHIPINLAEPEMIAAADIYSVNDQLVISKGTKLTESIISCLNNYLIRDIVIFKNISDNNSWYNLISEDYSQDSYFSTIKSSQDFKIFNEKFMLSVDVIKKELNDIVFNNNDINISKLLEQSSSLLAQCRNGIHVFDMLHCMRHYNDMTYVHSINVALICNVFGGWLNLPQDEINILTLCGILHDVGKLKMPNYILNKPSRLTNDEYTLIKGHPVLGYHILDNLDLNEHIKSSAYMHHERCDGSGYPNSYSRSRIDTFAKIVTIADVYDAMTSERAYRKSLSPFEAIKDFETEGLQKYDPKFIMTFLEGVVQSYIGKRVRLNNNLEGDIIMMNSHALSKPVIQVGEQFIDLSEKLDLDILRLI